MNKIGLLSPLSPLLLVLASAEFSELMWSLRARRSGMLRLFPLDGLFRVITTTLSSTLSLVTSSGGGAGVASEAFP